MATRDPYNQLQYLKQQYEGAGSNKGLQTWASNEAQKYYSMLSPEEAKRIQGMNASQLSNYRSTLNSPQTSQVRNVVSQPTYNPPVARETYNYQPVQQQNINLDQFKTNATTIKSLEEQYGFNYSREYAAKQAQAEAQAKRDAVEQGKLAIDQRLSAAADALDRNYFMQYQQQLQNQASTGLNAGIAADQAMRLGMSRQAELGDAYRDAALRSMELEDLANRIELEQLAREDSLFNERLQQGFQNSMTLTGLNQQENLAMLQAALQQRGQDIDVLGLNQQQRLAIMNANLQQRGQDIDQYQFGRDLALREGSLLGSYQGRATLDAQRLAQDQQQFAQRLGWEKHQFNNMSAQQKAALTEQQRQFNNLSASEKANFDLANRRLAEEKRQFNSEQAWRQYQYNNMSASERTQFNENKRQFGETMAWKQYEFETTMDYNYASLNYSAGYKSGSSGGSSSSSSSSSVKTPSQINNNSYLDILKSMM